MPKLLTPRQHALKQIERAARSRKVIDRRQPRPTRVDPEVLRADDPVIAKAIRNQKPRHLRR